METVYLSRRNLLTLLSKLDRQKKGETTSCAIIKRDSVHPKYPQSVPSVMIIALEDEEYYIDRKPGPVNPKDVS